MPSNHCVKGPSDISLFALAKELQRSWHFQRTFSKHQIGSPRWGARTARQREGPAAFGRSTSDTITLSQTTLRMLQKPFEKSSQLHVLAQSEKADGACFSQWRGNPPRSRHLHKAFGQLDREQPGLPSAFLLCYPAHLPLPSPPLAKQDNAEGCTSPADALAEPCRARVSETTLLSGHKSFWRPTLS